MRSGPACFGTESPIHVMPSRITRNSHRPRASDRTMVACEATSSLAALSNSMALPPSAKKPYENGPAKLLHTVAKLQWAGSREKISPPVEAEFFLDIPFYRTH
jgi:hypothetical protein